MDAFADFGPCPALAVAIPVKNEAKRIGECLMALARQRGGTACRVVLLLNNCTDGTAAVVRAMTPGLPMAVDVEERRFGAGEDNAGHARCVAMEHAAGLLGEGGMLLTTDADGRVAPDWIAATLAAMRDGAEVVAGRAEIDPTEARLIPAHLHEDDARECAYGDLLDEIDALLDPDPADPWPRHSEHSGASLAVRVEAFRRAGGVPDVMLGEDRAFVAALRGVDARIRHDRDVRVTVSGRIEGRAMGGMADTIRRRMVRQDALVDDRLEGAWDCARRAGLRARFRTAWRLAQGGAELASRLGLPRAVVEAAMAMPYFGAGWAALEAQSAMLARRTVARAELARETARARRIREGLRRDGVAWGMGAAVPA